MKSPGRFARSVAMITHRPVMGSLRNSGKRGEPSEIGFEMQQTIIAWNHWTLTLAPGIADPLDARLFLENHADDIEAGLLPVHAGAAGVVAGGALGIRPLLPGPRAIPGSPNGGGGRRDRHEDQCVAVPRHQIDFDAAVRRAVIAGHDRASLAAQVAMRQIFADAPMVVAQRAPPERIRRAIKQTDHFTTSNSNSIAFPRTT